MTDKPRRTEPNPRLDVASAEKLAGFSRISMDELHGVNCRSPLDGKIKELDFDRIFRFIKIQSQNFSQDCCVCCKYCATHRAQRRFKASKMQAKRLSA